MGKVLNRQLSVVLNRRVIAIYVKGHLLLRIITQCFIPITSGITQDLLFPFFGLLNTILLVSEILKIKTINQKTILQYPFLRG